MGIRGALDIRSLNSTSWSLARRPVSIRGIRIDIKGAGNAKPRPVEIRRIFCSSSRLWPWT